MAERREELRAKHHAALNAKRGSAALDAGRLHEATLDQLQAGQYAGIARTRKEKLARAGYRGQAPLVTFMFFRFVMPFIVFVVALVYLFVHRASRLVADA